VPTFQETDMNLVLFQSPLGLALAASLALTGCANLSPDADKRALADLTGPRVAAMGGSAPDAATRVAELLKSPLTDQAAVQIALLHSPTAQAALARLNISDAERVMASTWPTPSLSLARLTEGDVREIERGLHFNLLGLLTLPMQAKVQSQLHEQQRLQTAQDLVRLAAEVRKAWVRAVSAQQTARYMADAQEAAQASAELARRMLKAGHWSALQQQREALQLAQVQAQAQRAQVQALAEREALTRLLGLDAAQSSYRLPERLPDLPERFTPQTDAQALALRERLDVQAARIRVQQVGDAAGLENWQTWINRTELGYQRNTATERSTGHREVQRGWEVSIPLPLDGAAREARTQARLREAAALWQQTLASATSEVRVAHASAQVAHDLARQYRQQVLPLRQQISEEVLLRYNGMLLSVFDVLADARSQIDLVNATLQAERDFWIAQTDLQLALTGTSPGAMAALSASSGSAAPSNEPGH